MHLKYELILKQYENTSEYLKNQTLSNIETKKITRDITLNQLVKYSTFILTQTQVNIFINVLIYLYNKLIYLLMC